MRLSKTILLLAISFTISTPASANWCKGLMSRFSGQPKRPPVAKNITTGPVAAAKWTSSTIGWMTEFKSPWGFCKLVVNDNYLAITLNPLPGDYVLTDAMLARLQSEIGPVRKKVNYHVSFEYEGDTDQKDGTYSLFLEAKNLASAWDFGPRAADFLKLFFETIPAELRQSVGRPPSQLTPPEFAHVKWTVSPIGLSATLSSPWGRVVAKLTEQQTRVYINPAEGHRDFGDADLRDLKRSLPGLEFSKTSAGYELTMPGADHAGALLKALNAKPYERR